MQFCAFKAWLPARAKTAKCYGTDQRISVEEATKVWTLGGAYTSHEENDQCSITSGKLADFIVLRQDPHEVAPDTINATGRGECMY